MRCVKFKKANRKTWFENTHFISKNCDVIFRFLHYQTRLGEARKIEESESKNRIQKYTLQCLQAVRVRQYCFVSLSKTLEHEATVETTRENKLPLLIFRFCEGNTRLLARQKYCKNVEIWLETQARHERVLLRIEGNGASKNYVLQLSC